jgi:uncharacterized protein YbjT (DUF2867 family)
MAGELHVLFGAGQVGQTLARLLLDDGKRVRIAKRSRGAVPEGADVILGDASGLDFCVEAARGASTLYHEHHAGKLGGTPAARPALSIRPRSDGR